VCHGDTGARTIFVVQGEEPDHLGVLIDGLEFKVQMGIDQAWEDRASG
jgi:hypothetical protein